MHDADEGGTLGIGMSYDAPQPADDGEQRPGTALRRRRGSRFATCVGVVGLLASATTSAAEKPQNENRIVPVTPAREDTAISGIKREFDTTKSSHNPALRQKGDVPRLTMPEMPASTAGGWSPPKPPEPEKKSANWLVEAMDRQAGDQKAGRRDGLLDDKERAAGSRAKANGMDGADRGRAEAAKRQENFDSKGEASDSARSAPTVVVDNPLTRYLGDWMTPQDYALLKPGLTASLAAVGAREAGAPSAAATLTASAPSTGIETGAGRAVPPLEIAPKPRENPFLQALNSPVAPVFAPPVPLTKPEAPKNAGVYALPPPRPEPPKSPVPDFVKPAQDEKYFKPLKRF